MSGRSTFNNKDSLNLDCSIGDLYVFIVEKMNKLLLVLLIFLLLGTGCAEKAIEKAPVEEPVETFLRGVSLSPRSSSAADFTGFFEEAAEAGDIIMWAGDWSELSTEQGAPKVVTGLVETYGYIPLVEVTMHSNGHLIRPLNTDNLQIYRSKALAFVEEYKPEYLGLGIEVNIVYVESPEDFDTFVTFYNELYDVIKKVSPATTVFTVFQLERMKGLTMWEIEENKAHWELIDLFESDIIAFTTYPGLFYRNPSAIPDDHYSEISDYTDKSVAFTEIGWHSEASPKGWESSEAEQAQFIETFFRLTRDIDMRIAVWSFLYDPDIIEPFRSMGLHRADGTARPAWDIWTRR